jgi:hypothetical protein
MLTFTENILLQMPPLHEIKLQSKKAKKQNEVHQLNLAESSFLIKPQTRIVNQVQLALLTYSDNAEIQIQRALAGKNAADSYDFSLLNEILSLQNGAKAKVWTAQ